VELTPPGCYGSSMTAGFRAVVALLGFLWATLFFGVIDLSILFGWSDYFADVIPIEVSWGALLTFFLVVPHGVTAFRPASAPSAAVMSVVAALSLAAGALITGDARPMLLAAAALVSAVVLVAPALGPVRDWRYLEPARPRVRAHWLLAVFTIVGSVLWIPYIVNTAAAIGRLRDDVSIGISHWPVQVGAGIAILVAMLGATFLPRHRRMAVVASSLSAVTIGLSMAAYPLSPTATETQLWGILCVLWGAGVALGLALPVSPQRRRGSSK
jgi:hypothetical protein